MSLFLTNLLQYTEAYEALLIQLQHKLHTSSKPGFVMKTSQL